MSSNLIDKYISNTYTKIFQKSELSDSEGNESINIDSDLNNDSFTLVNGLGQKIRSFILDVGNPAGATMGYGIYFQTDSMKSSGDFGLRFSSINERGQITSQDKDILISSDNSTSGDSLEDRKRLILKGGIPGTMSFSNTDEGIVGGSVGTQSQITLLLQGRVSTDHDNPIVLNDFQNQELGLMSGVFKGEGPEELQIWSKVGNVVNVCGSWRWDPSGAGIGPGPSEVSMYDNDEVYGGGTIYKFPTNLTTTHATNNQFTPQINLGFLPPIAYDDSTGEFNVNGISQNGITYVNIGTCAIRGKIFIRYKRISDSFLGFSQSMKPNIKILKIINDEIFNQSYPIFNPEITNGNYNPPVPQGINNQSNWIEMAFSVQTNLNVGDTFIIYYDIDNYNNWDLLTSTFDIEFGNGSYVELTNAGQNITLRGKLVTMGNGGNISSNPYSTDLRFPIINGKNINRVWGNAKFRNESVNNYGYIKENIDSNNRPISASFFYEGNSPSPPVLSTQSLGPVDFSYSYILEF